MLPSARSKTSASTTKRISGLNSTAQLLAAYAAWVTPRLAQGSLPARWLGFDRTGLEPAGLHS